MELSKIVIDGLGYVGDCTIVSNSQYDLLLQEAFNVIVENKDWEPREFESGSNVCFIKQGFAALLTFVIESAKTDSPTISAQLEEFQWDEQRISALVKLYEANKLKVQAILSSYGHHLPHIVNVKWRQDYIVKNSWMSKSGRLEYLIQMDTEESGKDDTVSFSCNIEELQGLVDKLREANKCLSKQAQN